MPFELSLIKHMNVAQRGKAYDPFGINSKGAPDVDRDGLLFRCKVKLADFGGFQTLADVLPDPIIHRDQECDCADSEANSGRRQHDPIHGNCTGFIRYEIKEIIIHNVTFCVAAHFVRVKLFKIS